MFWYRTERALIPVSGSTPPRTSHNQRVRSVHGDRGWWVRLRKVTKVEVRARSRQSSFRSPPSYSQLRRSSAMPKPIGPSRLSQILKGFHSDPKPILRRSLKSIKLTYAAENDHYGARCVRRFPPTALRGVLPLCVCLFRHAA